MPIASFTCPYCKARVNHSFTIEDWTSRGEGREVEQWVDDVADESEVVVSNVVYDAVSIPCPRCKRTFEVHLDDLPQRIVEMFETLVAADKASQIDKERFEDVGASQSDDPIGEVISNAAASFAEAARSFEAETDVEIPQVDMERVISDERIEEFMSGAVSRVKAKAGVDSELANDVFDRAAEYATQWVGRKEADAEGRLHERLANFSR